ncbi:hypothetical protein BH20ACT2_BH20ACT2_08150 [soil metagenome]
MTEEASCIPDRLVRFNETVQAAADGLVRRVNDLDDALSTYVASCDAEYVVDCRDAAESVSEWRGNYRAFGTWTADVGRAFEAADEHGGTVVDHLPAMWADDPFLGVPAPTGAEDPIAGDQDGPPAWLETLKETGDLAGISAELIKGYAGVLAGLPDSVTVTVRITNGTVEILSDGAVVARYTQLEVTARLVTPRAGPGLTATGRWLSRAGNILGFVPGFAEQYAGDSGMPTDERLLRAATKGLGVGGGAMAGATAGLACGPGAPVCSTVLAIGGGILGGILGDKLTDLLPWMDEPEPGEHDLGAIEDVIADPGDGDGPGAAPLASVDLLASEVVRSDTADDPELNAEIESILPAEQDLVDIIDPPQPQPSSSPPTGTTTTTTPTAPASPQPGPSPSPSTTPSATTTTTPSSGP